MLNRELSKSEWKPFFEDFSKKAKSRRVEIEVAGLDIGSQISERWTTLEGLSYDPREDSFFVHMDVAEHQILHPQAIWLQEGDDHEVKSLEIRDADGRNQILKIKGDDGDRRTLH